jgi:hypothetical protein
MRRLLAGLTLMLGLYTFAPAAEAAQPALHNGPLVIEVPTFGKQPVGSVATRNVVIRNRGSQTVRIFGLAVTAQRGGFGFGSNTDGCLAPLSPGASCVQELTFTPNRAGMHTGDFCVESTDLTGVPYWYDCRRLHGRGTV